MSGGGSAFFAFRHILCWFWDPPMQKHGGVPGTADVSMPSSQEPHVYRPTKSPNANNIAEPKLYPSVRGGLIRVISPATLGSDSERLASGGRPNDASGWRMTRRGLAGQRKHSFGICLPPVLRSHAVQRSWQYRCAGSECGMGFRSKMADLGFTSFWKIPPKTFVQRHEQEADRTLSSDRRNHLTSNGCISCF